MEIIGRIKRKVKSGIMKVIIIILIILILFGLSEYKRKMDDSTWEELERGNPRTYTQTASISATEGIVVDRGRIVNQALIDRLYREKTDEVIDLNNLTEEEMLEIIERLDMSVKLGRKITSLDECTDAEILWCTSREYAKYLKKPEDLQKLLEAELITQYPKIDGLEEDKLNGIIEFERYTTDPDTQVQSVVLLKFISREEFTKKLEQYKKDGNTDVLNYFTLDENGNVIIATWTREEGSYYSNNTALQTDRPKIRAGMSQDKIQQEADERYATTGNTKDEITAGYTTYTITELPIYYKNFVQQYTMPFEFLWTLIVQGNSDKFALNLSDLVYESEIKMGIFDNINKSVNTYVENYTEEFKDRTETWEKNPNDSFKIVAEVPRYASVSEATRPPIDSQGGEWNSKIYGYTHKEIITTYQDTVQMQIIKANTWIVDVEVPFENTVNSETVYDDIVEEDDEDWDDSDSKVETDSRQDKYPDIMDEFNPDEVKVEGEPYTVDIEYRYYNYKHTINKSNESKLDTTKSEYTLSPSNIREKTEIIDDDEKNFIELLREDVNAFKYLTDPIGIQMVAESLAINQSTKSMVDLARYLLNKTKHPDDTTLTFDFSIFDAKAYNSIMGIYGGTVEEKVWFALKGAGFSDIATAAAMGNIYAESGFIPERIEYGYNENNGGIGLCQWTNNKRGPTGRNTNLKNFAASKGATWQDPDVQVEFLVGELTTGSAFLTTTMYGRTYTRSDWENATDVEVSTKAFCGTFERPGVKYFNSSMPTRVSKAMEYLQMFEGREAPLGIGEINLSEESIEKMTAMLNEAMRIANDNRYTYSQPNRFGEFQYDCSSFVSRLYSTYFGIQVPGTTSAYGTQYYVGSPGSTELQPGDVLWKSGHVVLYLGNGQIAEAWGRNNIAIPDQIRVTAYNPTRGFSKVYRFITN